MEPEQNIALQRAWSNGSHDSDSPCEKGARERAIASASILRDAGLAIEDVLVVGCRFGAELQGFEAAGAKNLRGYELVPDFASVVRGRGFDCIEAPAEEIGVWVDSFRWNIYCCHALEHFADRDGTLMQFGDVAKDWIWLTFPIESEPSRDKAHLSQVRSIEEITTLFPAWEWHEVYRHVHKSERIDGVADLLYRRVRQ